MSYVKGVWALGGQGPEVDIEIANNPGIVGIVVGTDWSTVEPDTDGVYDWDFLDAFIQSAKDSGFVHINVGVTHSTNDLPNWLLADIIDDGDYIMLRDPGSNHNTYCSEIPTPLYWGTRFRQKRLELIAALGEHLALRTDGVPHAIHCSFMNHNSMDWNIQDTWGTLANCRTLPCSLLVPPQGPGCSIDVDQPRQWIEAGFTRDLMLAVGKEMITACANAFPNSNLRLPIGGLDEDRDVDGVTMSSSGSPDPRGGIGRYTTLCYEVTSWAFAQSFANRFYVQRNTVDSGWGPPPAVEPGHGAENWIKWWVNQHADKGGLQNVAMATGQSPEYRQNGSHACPPPTTEIECELSTITASMAVGINYGVQFFEIWVQDARNPAFYDAVMEATLAMGGIPRGGSISCDSMTVDTLVIG